MRRVTDAVYLGAEEFDTGPLAAATASLIGDIAPAAIHGWRCNGRRSMDGDPPPGAIVAVSVDDRVHYATAGVAQRADAAAANLPVAMTWTARTDAGSVTKIVATVASLMALADAGQLDVDDPVSRYLPAFTARETTVRDLLEHRAGLWEWWPLYLSGARAAEAIATAVALPQRYPRGAGRHYSDIGFILLGALVARVAGEPLADAVRHLALEPFGLGETRYATPVPGGPIVASSAGDAIERAMVDSGVPYPVGRVEPRLCRMAYPCPGRGGQRRQRVPRVRRCRRPRWVVHHRRRSADASRAACWLHARAMGRYVAETARQFVAAGADPGQALGFRIWRDHRAGGDVGDGDVAIGHTGFPGVAFAMLPDRRAAAVMVTNRLHAPGPPRATEPMWDLARAAAHHHLDQHGHSLVPTALGGRHEVHRDRHDQRYVL